MPDPRILDANGSVVCHGLDAFEDADLIVRAVNAHADLLAACEAVEAMLEREFPGADQTDARRVLRAAIATATGK